MYHWKYLELVDIVTTCWADVMTYVAGQLPTKPARLAAHVPTATKTPMSEKFLKKPAQCPSDWLLFLAWLEFNVWLDGKG